VEGEQLTRKEKVATIFLTLAIATFMFDVLLILSLIIKGVFHVGT
jgi:hypothetical protein